MCILMGKGLAVFLNSFLLGLKMQKSFFYRKNGFDSILFYKIDVSVIINWSVRLEKTPNNLNFAYGRFFTHFFKNGAFFKICRDV